MDVFNNFVQEQLSLYSIIEGSVTPPQSAFIINYLQKNPHILRVLEIGFNGGLSAAAILSSRNDISLVSFDIGKWDYVKDAKSLIDKKFSYRHDLVIGDSTITVPEYTSTQDGTFDMAFIDGGHEGEVPLKDLENTQRLLKKGGIIIVDDYCEAYGRGGVIQGYNTMVERGLIRTIDGPFLAYDRGWIVGEKV